MLSYLTDYGHVTFDVRGLNDADRLVFSQLSYLDFEPGLVDVSLSDALKRVRFEGGSPSRERFSFQNKDDRALCALANCPRYAGLRYLGGIDHFDHGRETQFAAIALSLPENGVMIAFRGTDLTLAGWKEDVNLAFMDEIPAQSLACAWTDERGKAASWVELCGHSKGGNLALYASVFCEREIQEKIRAAVSFDGPGLSRAVIESEQFARVADRLRLRIPQGSLFGLLFHQPEDVRVVNCRLFSMLQHYPYFWKTQGMDLKWAEDISPVSRKLGHSVCGWIEKLPIDVRETFVEAVYEIIAATGAETLGDLVNGWARNTAIVVKKLAKTDVKTYRMLLKILAAFWISVAESFGVALKVDVKKWFDKNDPA